MQIGNFLKKGSGPILESKVMGAIFRAKGEKKNKKGKKYLTRAKYLKNSQKCRNLKYLNISKKGR